MKKLRPLVRIISILFILSTLLGSTAGCGRVGEQETVDRFLSYLQNAEYPRIYQLLTRSARDQITLGDLSKKYDDVYKLVGLQKAVCKLTGIKAVDDSSKTATFTMTATAEKLGQFTLNMEIPLRYEGGKWLIDWTTELILPELTPGDKASLRVSPAKRGEIFDATGEVLAKNSYAVSVYVDTGKVKNYETLIRLLAPELGMTEDDVKKRLASALKNAPGMKPEDDDEVPPEAAGVSLTQGASTVPSPSPSPSPSVSPTATPQPAKPMSYVIKAYPQGALTDEQKSRLLEIPGVGIDDNSMTVIRTYPYGDLMAHTLGYTGVMSEADLTKPENAGLPKDAIIGKVGLEQSFEQVLRGQPGYDLVIVDGSGNRKTTLAHRAGADGHDLRLAIDVNLQQRAEMLLREYLTQEMAGSIVVLDPETGYVQAIASAPSFDPNLFSFPVSEEDMKYLNDPVLTPQNNRATLGKYPPGSTFKPFTASMGLSDKKITAKFAFPYEIKNNKWTPGAEFGIDSPITRHDPTPSPLNLSNAIIHSDNIYFAYTALKVGGPAFYQHCLDLGFTKPMKFDVPLKTSSITNTGEIANLRQLADSGYGQGELLITPVQMASLFGSLENGGDIMLPRVVKSVCHTEGPRYVEDTTNPPEVWMQGVVPSYNLSLILPALKKVAQIGTAKDMNTTKLRPYEICAKTGTAEIGTDKSREIAWLIGFATKKMERLVCVTIEVPAGDGGIRTNIAKAMFEYQPPAAEEEDNGTSSPDKKN